jgi:plasmid stabilization system protein ParE
MASWSFTQVAEQEFESIKLFYAWHRATPTGDSVISAILDRIQLVATHPLAFPVDAHGIRRSPLSRLPYCISYEYEQACDWVHVLSVSHSRREQPSLR